MGMDVYGIKPQDETGKYFRNNISAWGPLWDTVCDITGNVLSKKQTKMGHHNVGIKITKKQSVLMSNILHNHLFGHDVDNIVINIDSFQKFYNKYQKNILNYPVVKKSMNIEGSELYESIKNIEDFIANIIGFILFTKSSGGFKID